MTRRRATLLPSAAAALWLWAAPTLAQSNAGTPASSDLWQRQTLLGDAGGLRPFLDERGVSVSLTEASEILGNLSGGLRRGAAYDGLTTASVSIDTAKAFRWSGGTLYASALQIHGRNLAADNLETLLPVSNIEADRATRLWEAWLLQQIAGDAVDLKIGQQAVDQEFIVSENGSVFLNGAMGWPTLPAADLYAGGPAYPLSSLGVRVHAELGKSVSLLTGAFDDNPPGGPFNADSQRRGSEASGLRFNLGTGVLFIGELQYKATLGAAARPGTYKLGAWVDTGRFPDQRFDQAGLSLADPASSGAARLHNNNFSLYGLADQRVWAATDGSRAVSVFARAMAAPDDRNLVDWSLNAGITVTGPFPGRDHDTLAIGYDWAHVSARAAALDRDTGLFSGARYPVRGAEHIVEFTYKYRLAPWCVLQPDLQYVLSPGGGLPSPGNPATRIGDELIVGLRTTITF